MGATDITEAQGQRRCDSVPSVVVAGSFPSVRSEGTKARPFATMEATTITEPQDKGVPIPLLLIPFPLLRLSVGSWLVPSVCSRSGKGKGVRTNGSNRHHRATRANIGATATIGGTQGNQPRQERSDSLVVIPFPLLRLLARSLSESSRSGKARAFASMGATDITEPPTATIGATATIPQLLSGKRSDKARPFRLNIINN